MSKQAKLHLGKDPIMKDLIAKYGDVSVKGNYMESAGALFIDLVRSIAGQQLSVKAATTIWNRVDALLGGCVTPEKILATGDDAFRGCGLSAPKTKYMKCIATAVVDGALQLDKLHEMTDEEVIKQLVQIKGIGQWTAEMFLIFALARPNVFSFGDIGLRNAMEKLYGKLSQTEQQEIVERWKPYRSYASLLLWASLDNVPMD